MWPFTQIIELCLNVNGCCSHFESALTDIGKQLTFVSKDNLPFGQSCTCHKDNSPQLINNSYLFDPVLYIPLSFDSCLFLFLSPSFSCSLTLSSDNPQHIHLSFYYVIEAVAEVARMVSIY